MGLLGKNIKYLRENSGITQEELGNYLKLNRGKIASYENGAANPNVENIISIARYFNVNIDVLLTKDISNYNNIKALKNSYKEFPMNYVIDVDRIPNIDKKSKQDIENAFFSFKKEIAYLSSEIEHMSKIIESQEQTITTLNFIKDNFNKK